MGFGSNLYSIRRNCFPQDKRSSSRGAENPDGLSKKIAFKPWETLVMCKPFCRHLNWAHACYGTFRRYFRGLFIHHCGHRLQLVSDKDWLGFATLNLGSINLSYGSALMKFLRDAASYAIKHILKAIIYYLKDWKMTRWVAWYAGRSADTDDQRIRNLIFSFYIKLSCGRAPLRGRPA